MQRASSTGILDDDDVIPGFRRIDALDRILHAVLEVSGAPYHITNKVPLQKIVIVSGVHQRLASESYRAAAGSGELLEAKKLQAKSVKSSPHPPH